VNTSGRILRSDDAAANRNKSSRCVAVVKKTERPRSPSVIRAKTRCQSSGASGADVSVGRAESWIFQLAPSERPTLQAG